MASLSASAGDLDLAAQLAVDLQHQLDFVAHQRGFVHVGQAEPINRRRVSAP
jgi:hypothetical protein